MLAMAEPHGKSSSLLLGHNDPEHSIDCASGSAGAADYRPSVGAVSARSIVATSALTLLAACGGDGAGGQPSVGPSPSPVTTVVRPKSDAEAAQFLLRASLYVSKVHISELRSEGFEPWLNRKFRQDNSETAAQFYSSAGFDVVDVNRYYDDQNLTSRMIVSQLFSGDNPVRKRIALALADFFVVSASRIKFRWSSISMGEYWDILNRNAFGNFRDMLEEITLTPAMGVFLDTVGNQKADPATGREPDENFAREVMQLFTIGLVELNLDGTPKLYDGEPVETYTNDDVVGLARCFTGYDFDYQDVSYYPRPNFPEASVPGASYARNPLTADPARWLHPKTESLHSNAEKSFLGTRIAENTPANETLRIALDTLFQHPNVGPFFGKQMIQRLVTSNPSAAYVSRVASAFNDNGKGVRGDLSAVFKAVLLDDEALESPNTRPHYFGRVKEPMFRVIQWGRTFQAKSTSGNWGFGGFNSASDQLGQAPLRARSVFGFFDDDYVANNSEVDKLGLVAPESELVNETSVIGYLNAIQRIIEIREDLPTDVPPNYSVELDLSHDAQALIDHLDLVLVAGQLSSATKEIILSGIANPPVAASDNTAAKLSRVHKAIFLVMASADFQLQR